MAGSYILSTGDCEFLILCWIECLKIINRLLVKIFKWRMMNSNAISHELSRWHFSRKQVAENYLKTLSSGVVLSTTVFAPSQTGLTHFFIHDICPCAHEKNYVTVYIDLSEPEIPVTVAVLNGLVKTFDEASFYKTGLNYLKGVFQTSRLGVAEFGKWAPKGEQKNAMIFIENKGENLDLIDSYFKKLSSYKSILVLIDHSHQLGQSDLGREFSVYFKNLIVEKSNAIKVLYATCDMDKWALIFKNRNSSLNSEGAFVHKLPNLGKVFVREMLCRMKLNISIDEAVQCFEMTGSRPGVFVDILMDWKYSCEKSMNIYFAEQIKTKN